MFGIASYKLCPAGCLAGNRSVAHRCALLSPGSILNAAMARFSSGIVYRCFAFPAARSGRVHDGVHCCFGNCPRYCARPFHVSSGSKTSVAFLAGRHRHRAHSSDLRLVETRSASRDVSTVDSVSVHNLQKNQRAAIPKTFRMEIRFGTPPRSLVLSTTTCSGDRRGLSRAISDQSPVASPSSDTRLPYHLVGALLSAGHHPVGHHPPRDHIAAVSSPCGVWLVNCARKSR